MVYTHGCRTLTVTVHVWLWYTLTVMVHSQLRYTHGYGLLQWKDTDKIGTEKKHMEWSQGEARHELPSVAF